MWKNSDTVGAGFVRDNVGKIVVIEEKLRETLKTALCKPIKGVNGNEYHTVLGLTRQRG